MARITGNDGNFSLATFHLIANTWSMTVTPTSTDVTGFGDTGKQMVTGMATFSGSASGFLEKDSGDTDPGLIASALEGQTGVACVLTAADLCTWTGDVIMTNSTVNANKNGETTVSFDFQFIGEVLYAWDET